MAEPGYAFAFYRAACTPAFSRVLAFSSDGEAIRAGKSMLDAHIVGEHTTSVSVGRFDTKRLVWLGAWDWNEVQLRWRPQQAVDVGADAPPLPVARADRRAAGRDPDDAGLARLQPIETLPRLSMWPVHRERDHHLDAADLVQG
jgi:hypothetical protein